MKYYISSCLLYIYTLLFPYRKNFFLKPAQMLFSFKQNMQKESQFKLLLCNNNIFQIETKEESIIKECCWIIWQIHDLLFIWPVYKK